MKIYLFILSLFFCGISFAQNSISGTVTNSKNEPVSGANVKVSGEDSSVASDFDGSFKLNASKPTVTLEVTMIGFETKKVKATSGTKATIMLQELETKLNEIVVSASRTPERVLESPVTIERMGTAEIKKSASPSFYDGLENMKEVQMNSSSLSFKSINTRGFATVANTRFMQLVDGMDNSSPLLNFVLGNLVGISEIDVQSVELLPGASSALYGANAFNGILFMTSKSPFTNEGITAYAKFGQTSQKAAGDNQYFDYGVRAAKKFSKHFAAKANFSILSGTDWFATDYSDTTVAGRDRSNAAYNGVNVYGDEAKTNIKDVPKGLFDAGRITAAQQTLFENQLKNEDVSRTGYREVDLTDNKVKNTKMDFSLHGRPFGDERLEIIWQSKFGFGNTVYTGANRYYLNNFFMQQHKIEFKGKNFFVRGYTTTEDGGRSYDMLFTGLNVNRAAKDDKTWFGQYATAFSLASAFGGADYTKAHQVARNYADNNTVQTGLPSFPTLPTPSGLPRFQPGTVEFKNAFNKVIADPDVLTGSKLVDNSHIYHSDANYNFRQSLVKFAEIQVGGSYRLYDLNSQGRIYTDKDSKISYNEYGTYLQARTKLMEDRLKLSASVRYDKAQNFDGNFSPRASVVYSAGEKKNHNIRASFQTGFRNPTTQDQYIGFNVGSAVLVGSAPDNLTRYNELRDVTGAAGKEYNGFSTTKTMTGVNAYGNSYTAASVLAFAAFAKANPGNTPGAAALLKVSNAKPVQPETVKAFELGYRTQIKDFSFDINGYYNTYDKFIGNLTVVAPLYGTVSETFNFTSDASLTPSPNSAEGGIPVAYRSNLPVQSLNALATGNTRNYQLYTNTDIQIKSLGFGLGISKKIIADFELGVNYNYAQFDFDQAKDPSFEASFNTPKQRVKVSLGNDKLFKNLGFNVSGRYNSKYKWESTFVDGVIEAATVIDAQLNYTIPALKSTLKIGAANIGGKEYRQVVGAGFIGQQYFASWTINP